jgi:NAD+ kinase
MPRFKPSGRLGLVLHPRSDATRVVEKLTSWARSHGKQVIVDARDAGRLPDDVEPVSQAQLVDQADALISLGGDGTLLGALRLRPVPVLGVNLGSLGFLVEIEPHELDAALDRLATDDYTIEEHGAAVLTDGADESIAFNDIALGAVPGEGAVQASLTVMGRASGRYRCDALVIATPIGSTAYSYAAGGPLVSPMLDAVVISPVAPISGISRPAVISAAEPIALALRGERSTGAPGGRHDRETDAARGEARSSPSAAGRPRGATGPRALPAPQRGQAQPARPALPT